MKKANLAISPWLSVFLVLLLLGLFGFLFIQSTALTIRLKENVVAVAFVHRSAPEAQIESLHQAILSVPNVEHVKRLESEDILAAYEDGFVEEIRSTLGTIKLPTSFEVYFSSASEDQLLASNLKRIEEFDYVEEVEFQNTLHTQITELSRSGYRLLLIGSFLIFLVSILLIRNSIRLDVFSKRKLIKSMQLVGATEGFILRPFLGKALIQGVTAAALAFFVAFLLTSSAWNWLLHQAQVFTEFREELVTWDNISSYIPQYSILFASLVVVAIVLTLGTTWISTRKYLRIRLDDLY